MGMLLPSALLFEHQSGYAQAQQQGTVVLDRLRSGILGTLPETLSVTPAGNALSLRPGDRDAPFTAVGTTQLLGHYDVYFWDSSRGELSFTPLTPTGHDFTRVGSLPVALFASLPTAQTRVLARHVTLFRVTSPLQFPLQVEITITPPGRQRKVEWSMAQKIMPPGGLVPQ